ncbi:transcriptional regulatory protein [Mycobacteroides abscessus subsp. abscessus]|uniref:TetR/AcrR family transcriptional regulator n=2 Tax=Mycobacteroides abscessus TaxID=36809 RepID=UPI0009270F5B|nr:helix-turn-helix domain-containing protein [Mycobacteroides abscessus]SHU55627.1 transcriptional regulatory protein [Mycobacteroides abscessus subsp. abscessus]SHX65662.1 transcriptional regulatory protein [Mycobacteroides abscessus subsp. abscessus]SIG92661.1 transcriptional regulatory protein [Mycobacteroides abscessus subsp. abscessus]SKD19023.1 transcriptional regulatory protein [Mycobacteroides abscessus subsp. abscessus]SKM54327.1 transcriptional regulatory protein [Mycobacteroides ab
MADDSHGRQRMVVGAADMIRRRGLNATSVRELAKHTDAPLGSTYHYFPGGKYALAAEAVRWADDLTAKMLTEALAAGPQAGLRAFLSMWRKIVLDSDFHAGCPALAVSIEDVLDEAHAAPRDAAAAAFARWTSLLADSLHRAGLDSAVAEQIATLAVASVEGTVAICRAQRSITPLDHVATQLDHLIQASLPGPTRERRSRS